MKKEACYGCGLGHGGKVCGMKGIYPDYPMNDKQPFRDSQAWVRGMKLKPKMGALSEVYDTQGEVMAKDIRQKLSDVRTTRQGKPSTPVPASKDVAAWGGAAAGTPGGPSGGLAEVDVYCLPCVVAATEVTGSPFSTNTAHRSTKLCECVSFAREGAASTINFSNTVSVFLSPTHA